MFYEHLIFSFLYIFYKIILYESIELYPKYIKTKSIKFKKV